MPRFTRPGLCLASAAATAFLVVSIRRHGADPPSAPRSIHDWDIPALAAHLNGRGVPVRVRATSRQGTVGRAAYLTTRAREWNDLSLLRKDPKRIGQWRGTLYCERVGQGDTGYLHVLEEWRDCSLVVGPFFFFGDPELLERVRGALARPATPATP